MHWRRKKGEPSSMYEQLIDGHDECMEGQCKKGYVPVLAGGDGERAERILVRVTLLKDPCMVALLDMAEQEFGHQREGILRLPCDAEHLRWVIGVISKHR